MSTQTVAALLTEREAMDYLHVSRMTLWRLRVAGDVRPVKIGASVRYPRTVLDAYIQRLIAAQD